MIGVTNWLSPNVSNPEMVLEVELKGNASAKPRFELRASVWCRKPASKRQRAHPGGAEGELIADRKAPIAGRPRWRRSRVRWPARPDRFEYRNCPSPRARTTESVWIEPSQNASCPDNRGTEPARWQARGWTLPRESILALPMSSVRQIAWCWRGCRRCWRLREQLRARKRTRLLLSDRPTERANVVLPGEGLLGVSGAGLSIGKRAFSSAARS